METGGVTFTVLLLFNVACALGKKFCENPSPSLFGDKGKYCEDDEYCCGELFARCCDASDRLVDIMGNVIPFIVLVAFIVIPICICYRCCCSGQSGYIYTQSSSPPVTVVSPPQVPYSPVIQPQMPYSSVMQPQVPYPSMVPYPQQTPYSSQPPINPYIGMQPPPPYGSFAQDNIQQASAPTL